MHVCMEDYYTYNDISPHNLDKFVINNLVCKKLVATLYLPLYGAKHSNMSYKTI